MVEHRNVMKHRDEEASLVAPAAWASVTLVLTVITLTLDPDWAYLGAWAAGFITFYAVIARAIRMDRHRRLASQDEALLLEVRKAMAEEEDEGTPDEVGL
jgi:hypothetical protein